MQNVVGGHRWVAVEHLAGERNGVFREGDLIRQQPKGTLSNAVLGQRGSHDGWSSLSDAQSALMLSESPPLPNGPSRTTPDGARRDPTEQGVEPELEAVVTGKAGSGGQVLG
jgi:hypothetical protein